MPADWSKIVSQNEDNNNASASLAAAVTSATTAGRRLFAFIQNEDAQITTVIDSQSNPWTKLGDLATYAGGGGLSLWTTPGATALSTSDTVTFTKAAAGDRPTSWTIFETTGADLSAGTGCLRTSSTSVAGGHTSPHQTGTTAGNGEVGDLAIALFGCNDNVTWSAHTNSFVSRTTFGTLVGANGQVRHNIATKVVTAQATQSCDATRTGGSGTAYSGRMFVIKAAAGGSTPTGSASSTAGFTSTASGRRKALRGAATSTGATSAETGRRKAIAHHDEASAVPPFTIPVLGALTTTGLQSAATGDQVGVETHSGAATTTVGLTTAATGRRKAQRAATTTTAASSASTGARKAQRAASTTAGLSSAATGRRKAQTAATVTIGAVSSASWRRVSRGTASTTVGITSAGTGNDQPVETHQGAAATTCGLTSSATGRRRALRSAVSSNGITSAAAARRSSRGACATTVGLSGTAAGVNGAAPVRSGTGSTILGLTSAATGRRSARGSCLTGVGITSTGRGARPGAVTFEPTSPPGTHRRGRIGRHAKASTGHVSTKGVVI